MCIQYVYMCVCVYIYIYIHIQYAYMYVCIHIMLLAAPLTLHIVYMHIVLLRASPRRRKLEGATEQRVCAALQRWGVDDAHI